MYYIKDAKIRRMTEYDGAPCAEVGVLPGAVGDSALLVYIVEDRREEGYEIVRILTNDADTATDWFDNNLHDAFQDVTVSAFTGSAIMTPEDERSKFQQELLIFGDLKKQLEAHFHKLP
ncbi:hypothetical protein JI735_02495 [Paenibacillus sonchi]|uniref:Uncharacterized protein n=1 Tax=Paenibacillus sonchi TaxID=373687 RepID=A0A974PD74_9BACL|nr:hypothetical protein [Paenibacillus sonchi]MCE3202880.1 hypothetical protein [Paenibacillus sonchi]QQZ61651.1 hypothetical protein JI735_02495 [Paenibacillus sonchi]